MIQITVENNTYLRRTGNRSSQIYYATIPRLHSNRQQVIYCSILDGRNRRKPMPRQSVFDMPFRKVYVCLIQKAERKGRPKQEVDQVTSWLTGYENIDRIEDVTYGEFLLAAPAWNPRAELIKGTVCGVRVEEIEDPLTKRMRQLDKLVDELAKGKPMEKVLR